MRCLIAMHICPRRSRSNHCMCVSQTCSRLTSDAAHLEGCATAVVKLPWHVHGACRVWGKLGNNRLKQGHLQRRTAAIACLLHGLLHQSAWSA